MCERMVAKECGVLRKPEVCGWLQSLESVIGVVRKGRYARPEGW